ncbi:hypothetical protein IAT40_007764 [Kwoniella sp. CBS 6097]
MSDHVQVQLPPPRLIITPSTPLLADTFDHDASSSLPSPSGSRQMPMPMSSSLPTISEKRSSRSRSGSRSSSSSSRTSSSSRSYDAQTKTQRCTSPMYLSPPPSLTSPMSGKRPLRSPLISILFIGFTLMLLLSTAFCTSDASVRLLEMQQEKFRVLREKSGKALSFGRTKYGANGGGRKDFVAGGSMEASTAPCHGATVVVGADSAAGEVDGSTGEEEDGLIMSSEEWEHYTNTIGGPAVSMGGQVWDIEW